MLHTAIQTSSAVVTIHGFLGSPADFSTFNCRAGHPRYDLDLFGRDALQPGETKSLWLERMRTQLEGLSTTMTLVGYSLGGRIALELFARSPDKYEKVIVIAAHPGLQTETERSARQMSDEAWAEKLEALPAEEFLGEWNAQEALRSSAPLTNLPHCERSVLASFLRTFSLAHQPDFRPLIAAHASRIIYVAGSKDKKFAALGTQLKQASPALTFELLQGVGHRLTPEHFR